MTHTQDATTAAKDAPFNGWTNCETWAVALWIDNDSAARAYWNKKAAEEVRDANGCWMVRDGLWAVEDACGFRLSTRLKREISGATPDLGSTVYSDLMRAALDVVNWLEIAGSLIEGLGE